MTQRAAIGQQPFFLSTPRGARFALATRPVQTASRGLLYVHPFAEELNKSRRTAALAARTFAERGWLVLQLDLMGCGDSDGDFGDADWGAWLDDVSRGVEWLRRECGTASLWTLRAGSLIAADWLKRESSRPPLLLWQPVSSGSQHLGQFLRLKSANQMLAGGSGKDVDAQLRAELKAGRSVEISGYRLSPGLAAGLGAAEMRLPAAYPAPIAVLEVVGTTPPEPSPAVSALATKWRAAGAAAVIQQAVTAPSFWRAQEIETAPELIAASAHALDGFAP